MEFISEFSKNEVYMKNILFICNGLSFGGAERVINILANNFIEKGYKVFILAFTDMDESYKLNENIITYCVSIKNKKYFLRRIKRIAIIRKYIIKNKIDVAVSFSYYNNISLIFAAIGLKLQKVISERNDPAQIESKYLINYLRKLTYPKADLLICQTPDALDYYKNIMNTKSIVIPNPLMENLPLPYMGERKKEIISFSRIEPQKNIKMIIDAFCLFQKDYSEYSLKIYGNGTCVNELQDYIYNLGLENKAFLYPFCLNIHEKVKDASIFVLGSNYEGLSNSMLEAMAIGLPVIVTDCPCGGARMVIENGINGIIVPVRDVNAMYNAMKLLTNDKKLANDISKNAIKIKETLSSKMICLKWEKAIFKNLK